MATIVTGLLTTTNETGLILAKFDESHLGIIAGPTLERSGQKLTSTIKYKLAEANGVYDPIVTISVIKDPKGNGGIGAFIASVKIDYYESVVVGSAEPYYEPANIYISHQTAGMTLRDLAGAGKALGAAFKLFAGAASAGAFTTTRVAKFANMIPNIL